MPQVIDFTNQDTSWAIGAVIWAQAQSQPGFSFAYRTAPSTTAWTYPISVNPALNKPGRALTIALLGDWGTAGTQASRVVDPPPVM